MTFAEAKDSWHFPALVRIQERAVIARLFIACGLAFSMAVNAQENEPAGKIAAEEPGHAPSAVVLQQPMLSFAAPVPMAWVEASVLSWQIKDGPLPFPIVTTGNLADTIPGALGQPGTQVVYGGNGLDYGRAAGMRFSAGFWLPDEPFGGEISAFGLQRRRTAFAVASDSTGSPPIYLAAFNAATDAEGSLVVADPLLLFGGGVSVTSESRLRGMEVNGLAVATTCSWCEIDLLAGVRVIDLEESLILQNPTSDLLLGTSTDLIDRFDTQNRFFGGQVVHRATFNCDKFFASVTGKIAMGWVRSQVSVLGSTTQTSTVPGVPTGTFPVGYFTQATNIGQRRETDCTIVPEINLRAGCDLFGCVRAFIGYDWLYWGRVVRPGDQIDRSLNLTQNPVFGTGTLAGPARPTGIFELSTFFAHGVSAGIELRYRRIGPHRWLAVGPTARMVWIPMAIRLAGLPFLDCLDDLVHLVAERRKVGVACSPRWVAKIMKNQGLRAIQPKSIVPKTTDSRHHLGCSPNLILDTPEPCRVNQLWVGDITYVPLRAL